jgi:hypothetical protein
MLLLSQPRFGQFPIHRFRQIIQRRFARCSCTQPHGRTCPLGGNLAGVIVVIHNQNSGHFRHRSAYASANRQ